MLYKALLPFPLLPASFSPKVNQEGKLDPSFRLSRTSHRVCPGCPTGGILELVKDIPSSEQKLILLSIVPSSASPYADSIAAGL